MENVKEMNCRFVVITTVWSEKEEKQVKIIRGMFAGYTEAVLFAKAYSAHYKTVAEIKAIKDIKDINYVC